MYLERRWPKIFDINIHQKINLSQLKGDSKEVSFQKEKKIEAAARLHATLINCYTVVTTSSDDVLPNKRPRYSWDDMLSSSSRQLYILCIPKARKIGSSPRTKSWWKRDIFKGMSPAEI